MEAGREARPPFGSASKGHFFRVSEAAGHFVRRTSHASLEAFWGALGTVAKAKTIYRNASRENPYAQIVRSMLQDEKLSLEAAGTLVFVLSLPDTWEFNFEWLCRRRRIGRDKALRIVRELIARGYCRKVRDRDARGRLSAVTYEFSDDPAAFPPLTENPLVDAQDVVSPHTEKPTVAEPTVANPPPIESRDQSEISTKDKQVLRYRATDGAPAVSADVLTQAIALGVDVEALALRFARRTKGHHITDPSAYFLRMAHDEAAKRHGVSIEDIKNSTARSRAVRTAATVGGPFHTPSRAVIDDALRRNRRNVPRVLELIAQGSYATQQACDAAFSAQLINARFWPSAADALPDLFQPQKEETAA